MKQESMFSVLMLLLFAVLFNGCSANTYDAQVLSYVEPEAPAEDETSIFVFRENSALGSARKFAIIANDTVVDVVTPGTFCNFNVKSGENEIVAYVSGPLMHYRVQDRPGETVYLYCKVGYTTGLFIEEIDHETAHTMMQSFKYMDISKTGKKLNVDYRDFYDNLYK
ncbi:hypothetical protein [Desulfosediminicola flagellatus]|uniref:hypothetical protein n=1 Tax=Desulfosediminicola flagellatus TaxID=2569541 RepID=UPI0010ACD716|nr:hypothetical protein [Desulfosediminicola flagellatus]